MEKKERSPAELVAFAHGWTMVPQPDGAQCWLDLEDTAVDRMTWEGSAESLIEEFDLH